jgi:spermidine synthase
MPTTVVEINPAVVRTARLWFRLPPEDDARLTVVVGDAQAWVDDDANAGSTAVLNVDLYDHRAASPVLDDDAFYVGCRRVLADGGVMSVNLFGREASFAGSAARIVAAFGRDQVWRMTPTREGNSIVIAARGIVVPERDELERRAAAIASRYKLPARKWLRMVRPATL